MDGTEYDEENESDSIQKVLNAGTDKKGNANDDDICCSDYVAISLYYLDGPVNNVELRAKVQVETKAVAEKRDRVTSCPPLKLGSGSPTTGKIYGKNCPPYDCSKIGVNVGHCTEPIKEPTTSAIELPPPQNHAKNTNEFGKSEHLGILICSKLENKI